MDISQRNPVPGLPGQLSLSRFPSQTNSLDDGGKPGERRKMSKSKTPAVTGVASVSSTAQQSGSRSVNGLDRIPGEPNPTGIPRMIPVATIVDAIASTIVAT